MNSTYLQNMTATEAANAQPNLTQTATQVAEEFDRQLNRFENALDRILGNPTAANATPQCVRTFAGLQGAVESGLSYVERLTHLVDTLGQRIG